MGRDTTGFSREIRRVSRIVLRAASSPGLRPGFIGGGGRNLYTGKGLLIKLRRRVALVVGAREPAVRVRCRVVARIIVCYANRNSYRIVDRAWYDRRERKSFREPKRRLVKKTPLSLSLSFC